MYDYSPTHCTVTYEHISHNLHRLVLDALASGIFSRYSAERDAFDCEWSDALYELLDGDTDAFLFNTSTDLSYEVTLDHFSGHTWRITAFDERCEPIRHRCYDDPLDFIRGESMDNVTLIKLHIWEM